MSAKRPPPEEASTSVQITVPVSARKAESSPEPKPATTIPSEKAGAGRPSMLATVLRA